jgi:hypothetical protein
MRNVNQESEMSSDVVAYPNPFEDKISLNVAHSDKGNVSIEVMDLNGQKLFNLSKEVSLGNHDITIHEMESLPAGIYFVQVKSSTLNKVIKVIKR